MLYFKQKNMGNVRLKQKMLRPSERNWCTHTRHSGSSDLYQLIERLTLRSHCTHPMLIPFHARKLHVSAKEKPKGKLKINISL